MNDRLADQDAIERILVEERQGRGNESGFLLQWKRENVREGAARGYKGIYWFGQRQSPGA
jgi:hypothetical protein